MTHVDNEPLKRPVPKPCIDLSVMRTICQLEMTTGILHLIQITATYQRGAPAGHSQVVGQAQS